MSLRSRVMVAFAYLLLLAVVALSVPLGINVARKARDDFAVQLNNWAERVAVNVPRADGDPAALRAIIEERPEFGRVIVTDAQGLLIADSTDARPIRHDYTRRPEIVTALKGRPTRLVRDYEKRGLEYVVAVPVVNGQKVIGAVRVGKSVEEVDAVVRQRLMYIAAGALGVLFMALLVSLVIARSLTRPLRRLGSVAARIGDGELGAQAEESGQREVAEVAHALNSMSRRIEQAMTAQTDFVANASHQLRTPLTGLRLRLEQLAAAGVEGAVPALAETDRLGRLVDDLLTLVRAGTDPEVEEITDFALATRDAVDRWALQAAEVEHPLILEGAEDAHPIEASSTDVAIVLDNLIENALKYTPAGTTVTVSLAERDDDIVLAVADDGPGMAVKDRERAFERFYRGATGKATTGTGLGLAIVRQMVERWRGQVDMSVGNGTRFEVSFPRADVTATIPVDSTDRIPTLH